MQPSEISKPGNRYIFTAQWPTNRFSNRKKTTILTIKFFDMLVVVQKENIFTKAMKLALRVGEVTVERRSESKGCRMSAVY